jgi:hypothetical protein
MPRAPLGRLAYLYVASRDVEADLHHWTHTIGGRLVWDFTAFGTRVAAVRVGTGPLLLVAGHRRPPSVLPVYAVPDLDATTRALRARGWRPTTGPFGIPDGPCYLFEDKSGNAFALFGNERPNALTAEFRRKRSARSSRGRGRAGRKGP